MITVNVADFTEFPGPRFAVLGLFSGEEFREKVLLNTIREHGAAHISVNLDGTAGYGSSFLEEAFGGLVRAGVSAEDALEICKNLVSEEDPSLIDEICSYIKDAIKANE